MSQPSLRQRAADSICGQSVPMKKSATASPRRCVFGEKYVDRYFSMYRPFNANARNKSASKVLGTDGQDSIITRTHSQERLRNATSRLLPQLMPIGYGFASCHAYHCLINSATYLSWPVRQRALASVTKCWWRFSSQITLWSPTSSKSRNWILN